MKLPFPTGNYTLLLAIKPPKRTPERKGALVAMVKGTQADTAIEVLRKIPKRLRDKVREVTLDMAANMNRIVTRCFVKAEKVIDLFHVQKLEYDAVQEIRIKYRWEALDQENESIKIAKIAGKSYNPELLEKGDTLKQLLARSKYFILPFQIIQTLCMKLSFPSPQEFGLIPFCTGTQKYYKT